MDYQDALDRLAQLRSQNEDAITGHQEHVGRQLSSLRPKALNSPDLENLQSQVKERIMVLLDERRRTGQVIQLRGEVQKISERLRGLIEDRESIQKDAEPFYADKFQFFFIGLGPSSKSCCDYLVMIFRS